MTFNQNQIKANTAPNYFNNKNLFSTTDNSLGNFYETTINNSNKNNTINDVGLAMMAQNRAGNQHSFYTNKLTSNELDEDEHENSILINQNQQQRNLNLSESKELIEINNRLGYYINAVRILNKK